MYNQFAEIAERLSFTKTCRIWVTIGTRKAVYAANKKWYELHKALKIAVDLVKENMITKKKHY